MSASDPFRRTDDPHAPGPAGHPSPGVSDIPGAAPPMHNEADHFSKSLLRDALSCASMATPETEVEVVAATQRIDVYAVPDPARAAEREKMGLLGELSVEPSLFEPFRNTPNLPPVRRVMCKQLTWHHELERRARVALRAAARAADRVAVDVPAAAPEAPEEGAPQFVPFPWLIVISQGRPDTVIEMYGCKKVHPGVYEAVPGLQMRSVVLAELPQTRQTLLLRLLGGGPLLAAALEDLDALPADAYEKSVAAPLLVHFGRARRRTLSTNEEDDVSAEIRAWFEGYKQELRATGRDEGRAEEAARSVLTVLRVRGVAVPDAVRERILAQTDPSLLERWHERAIVASSAADVIDEPS